MHAVLSSQLLLFFFSTDDSSQYCHPAAMATSSITYTFENHHTILNDNHHSVLYKQLVKYCAKWREIGRSLGFLQNELDNIEAIPSFPLSSAPGNCLSRMLVDWLQWAPGDDRGSMTYATLEGLKFALKSVEGLEMLAKDVGV